SREKTIRANAVPHVENHIVRSPRTHDFPSLRILGNNNRISGTLEDQTRPAISSTDIAQHGCPWHHRPNKPARGVTTGCAPSWATGPSMSNQFQTLRNFAALPLFFLTGSESR